MTPVQELLQKKRADVALRRTQHPLRVADAPSEDRRIRWSKNRFHLIAEIKRSSLSAGVIRSELKIDAVATAYEKAGVSAVSILTEEHHFGGSLEDLQTARDAVSLPLLQKDFLIDEYQLLEAKKAGADFVLLIARFLEPDRLSDMLSLSDELKMNALVEITEESDLSLLKKTPCFLGVNSRDLETLKVDTARFASMRALLPETFRIAESGIQNVETLKEVIGHGYHGALIGEHLLRAPDPGREAKLFVDSAKAQYLSALSASAVNPPEPKIKICGITNEKDAMNAVEAGANALGFVFADSPRKIDLQALMRFHHRIPPGVLCVGVFRGQSAAEVESMMRRFDFDVAQIYDPLEISFPVWRAKMVSEASQIDGGVDVIDLKMEGSNLMAAWSSLQSRNVFMLAGNLHPENVGEAVRRCRPKWIDVARGVESAPGIKDESKLRNFIKNARGEK